MILIKINQMLSVHFSTSERTRTAKRDAQRILSASSLPISPQRLITIYIFHNVKELFVSFNITKLQHFFLFCKFLMLKIVSLKRFELLRYLSSLQPLL